MEYRTRKRTKFNVVIAGTLVLLGRATTIGGAYRVANRWSPLNHHPVVRYGPELFTVKFAPDFPGAATQD